MRPYPHLFRALLFVTLFAVLAVAPAFAGTSPVAVPAGPVSSQASPPTAPADFLGSLAAGGTGAPSAIFETGCSSNADCPAGQLCCLACGFDGCETKACFAPVKGHCPQFP